MPEGWAHVFHQTESLIRLVNPVTRKQHPGAVSKFYHYMTENGVTPPECGINDPVAGWDLKAKAAMRAYAFWLNKGIESMHYYSAYAADPLGFGILPPGVINMPVNTPFSALATPPLQALKNLTQVFNGSVALTPRQLTFEPTALGAQPIIFDGDANHPPLYYHDVLALLPYHVNVHRMVVGIYTMTFDITHPGQEVTYRLKIGGINVVPKQVRLYDPYQDTYSVVNVKSATKTSLLLDAPVSDQLRLLIIDL